MPVHVPERVRAAGSLAGRRGHVCNVTSGVCRILATLHILSTLLTVLVPVYNTFRTLLSLERGEPGGPNATQTHALRCDNPCTGAAIDRLRYGSSVHGDRKRAIRRSCRPGLRRPAA